jgi:hypothetical protein
MLKKFRNIKNFIDSHAILYFRTFQRLYRKLYPGQHQLTSTTYTNRYPELFHETKQYAEKFLSSKSVSILSFGCSTGEECISLKSYFAEAKIVGADINKLNIRKAERINNAEGISYILSSSENIEKAGKYDLIFCLSVLCRWEDTKYLDNCEKIYPFSKFEKTVNMLTDHLNFGGMIIIYNSNFRFEDTKRGAYFEVLQTPSVTDSGFVQKFDSHNNRLNTSHIHCIYRKVRE